ncbi:hypothetical protein RAF81_11595, partial [Klebsiella quasipneumoniae subsp. similipneumoniae]
VFAGKKSAQIREILISESAWEEMTCLFAPSLTFDTYHRVMHIYNEYCMQKAYVSRSYFMLLTVNRQF